MITVKRASFASIFLEKKLSFCSAGHQRFMISKLGSSNNVNNKGLKSSLSVRHSSTTAIAAPTIAPDDEEDYKHTRTNAPLTDGGINDELDEVLSDAASSFTEYSEKSKAFQLVLDMVCVSSMDPVLIITEKGTMKSCNDNCMQMFSYKRWEIVGKNIKMMMPRRFSMHHDKFLARYFKTKMKRIIGEYRDDIIALDSKGVEFPVILKVQEIVDPDSGTSFIGVLKNISAQKELERITTLLNNVLPREITTQLADDRTLNLTKNATIAIIQLKGFKSFMSKSSPKEGMNILADALDFIDTICDEFDIDRVKNYGESVLVYCTEEGKFDHALRVLEMIQKVNNYIVSARASSGNAIELRSGVAFGTISLGVVQSLKMSFDVYGEVLDQAERFLKYTSAKNPILVSQKVYQSTNFKFDFENGVFEIPASEEDKNTKIQGFAMKCKA